MVIKAFFPSSSLHHYFVLKKILIQRSLSFASFHFYFGFIVFFLFVSARKEEGQREPARILGSLRIGLSDRGLPLVALIEFRRDCGIVFRKYVSFSSFRSPVSSSGDVYTLRGLLFLCVCHFHVPFFFYYGKAVGAYGKRVLFYFLL